MSDSSSSEAGATTQPAILCDMCTDEDRRAAMKTCMKCEISMCAQHLQPHLTAPVLLLSHPLTEPMAPGAEGLGGTKCPQHGKLLEYYCLDDLTSVCVSCAIEDQHRLHNMKTLPKAHAELVGKLAEEERAAAGRRQESEKLGSWEQSKREEVSRSSLRLIEAVSKLRDMALNRVKSSVSARMDSIATGGRSLQAAKDEKDTFRFLKLYSQVQRDVEMARAVDLRTGLETGQERDKLSQELQVVGAEMIAQATKLCGSVLMFVDPENHQELTGNAMATFDPLTLIPGMSLSADQRKAFYNNQSGALPPYTLMIKGADSVDINRWTIAVSENYDWTIGFCDDASAIQMGNGHVYALCIENDQLSYMSQGISSNLNPGDGAETVVRPKTVEVCWNPITFSLSFFSRSRLHYQRSLIVSIDVSRTCSAFNPFVKLQSKAGIHTVFGQYSRTTNKQRQRHVFDVFTPIIDQTPITDELCELL
ncbi:unnamed protein product [Lota lota]